MSQGHEPAGLPAARVTRRVTRARRDGGPCSHLVPTIDVDHVKVKLRATGRRGGLGAGHARGRAGDRPQGDNLGDHQCTAHQPSVPQLQSVVAQNYSMLPTLPAQYWLLNKRTESSRRSGRTHGRRRKVERAAEYSPWVTGKTTVNPALIATGVGYTDGNSIAMIEEELSKHDLPLLLYIH